MLAAAVAAGWSTYLYWLPCRASMVSAACWRRMGTPQAPWVSELGLAATALAGVAWLTLVLRLPWQLRTRVVAALPGLATLAVALVGAIAIGDASFWDDEFVAGWPTREVAADAAWFGIEASALVALLAIGAWQREVPGRVVLRLVVVLWGTTAFGVIHLVADYLVMIIVSGALWAEHGFPDETPPGTGYVTVAVITISAILTAIMTIRAPKSGDDEPDQDHHSESLTPRLSAVFATRSSGR
jgi:hypothetical protein